MIRLRRFLFFMDSNTAKMLAQDLSACYADPLRFVLWAFPWGGTPEMSLVPLPEKWRKKFPNCEFGPDAWACEFLDAIGKYVKARKFDGKHAVDPIRMAVASGHGIGKSAITAWLACWILATRPNSKGVVTANTASQLETKTWAEITKWMKRSVIGSLFECTSTSITSKESPETWRMDALTCREENAESFAGLHAASSTPFYIFDEASAIPEAVYDVAEGGLTDGEPMMFLFGNPTRNSGRFFEVFHRRAKFWDTRTIDSRTVQITNKKQIANWAEEYGEDSDFFKVRVRGEFPSSGADQFIPVARVREAMERGAPESNPATCAVVGVDVARFGDDDTVIFTRIGRDGVSVPLKRFHGLDTVQVVGKVKEHVRHLRNKLGIPKVYVFVDEGGVGGGSVDILKTDGFPVRGVNFSQSPDDKDKYPGKREEMWDRMGEWLKEGSLQKDTELEEDLVSPTYQFDVHGRRKLESKKEMKKRGLRSPDSADALALTFSYRVNEYEGEYGGRSSERRIAEGRREYNPFKHFMRNYW